MQGRESSRKENLVFIDCAWPAPYFRLYGSIFPSQKVVIFIPSVNSKLQAIAAVCKMKFSVLPALAVASCLGTRVIAQDDAASLNALMSEAANNILAQLEAEEVALAKRGVKASCTVSNIAIRQELYGLNIDDVCLRLTKWK